MAVLQVHPRRRGADRGEYDLDLARFRGIGLIAPVVRDLPGEDEAPGRVPDEDGAPIRFGRVGLLGVAAPSHPALDHGAQHLRAADVMRLRPPGVDLGREHVERVGGRRMDDDGFAYRDLGEVGRHALAFRVSPRASTRRLKSPSATDQNSSKYARSETNASPL